MIKISYNWLQKHIEQKLPPAQEVADAIHAHAFEIEGMETVGDDTVFDVAVLPDRAGDCLSHEGMARELAGLLKLTLKEAPPASLPEVAVEVPVEVQSDACRAYLAVRIDGVKIAPSPAWLKQSLESIGQKSINNIVDATNFILNDVGQPVHAFDAANIDGGIVVRLAKEGETIRLLGGEEKTLKETDLVVADYLGGVAIAGVKGGASAEVTNMTTSVILEVANFDPVAVRKTSRRLNLITDASKRFENNFSPAFALYAMERVVALILELAGGTVSAVTKKEAVAAAPRAISFELADITRLLGTTITETGIEDVFSRYGYSYKKEGEAFILTVPHFRADLAGSHDIAEEIGRVTGYEYIPSVPLPFHPIVEPHPIDLQISAVRAWCLAQGYAEVYNYTFRANGEVAVAYGAKGKDKLRSSLSDGLKDSFELNRLNAPLLGAKEVRLFEIGTVFFADREELHVALCDKGTLLELPLSDFVREKAIDVAVTALPEVSPSAEAFKSWSLYPFMTRDIAAWVQDGAKESFTGAVREFASTHCVRDAQLFDEFSKEGRTSVAYRFVFQASDRTLTDTEIAALWEVFTKELASIEGVELR